MPVQCSPEGINSDNKIILITEAHAFGGSGEVIFLLIAKWQSAIYNSECRQSHNLQREYIEPL